MPPKGVKQPAWQLALDAGTNSIGWAVFRLAPNGKSDRLLAGGVRLFDWGRDNVKKFSLNKERGAKRRERRRVRAKVWRREKLREALVDLGLPPPSAPIDVWELRAKAASEPVGRSEFAACLMHMGRHRGFKSLKLVEDDPKKLAESNEELNKWNEAERTLRQEMTAGGFTTVGQLFATRLCNAWRHGRQAFVRARRGIGNVPTRRLVRDEFAKIREHQTELGLAASQWDRLEDIIFEQRPITPPPAGRCSLYPEDSRIARAMPSAQRFRIRQTLCDLRIEGGLAASRFLNKDEYVVLSAILDKGGEHTWAALRKEIGLPRGAKFSVERERVPGLGKKASKSAMGDQTAEALAALLPGWTTMALAEQDSVVTRLLERRRNRRDLLAYGRSLGLDEAKSEEIADFAQFNLPRGYLSFGPRAVREVLEHLGPGISFSEAVERVTGRVYAQKDIPVLKALPYYGEVLASRTAGGSGVADDPPERKYGRLGNITVHIALNEIRKIVNALIARYGGNPTRIVVETTRELKANTTKLVEILSEQRNREKHNAEADDELARASGGQAAKSGVNRSERLRRYRLWKRQKCLCPYTGKNIGLADLCTSAYQADHIIPLSRGGTDVEHNLVVCTAGANSEKLNKTPWEAWHGTDCWRRIEDAVRKLPEDMRWRFAEDAASRAKEDDGGWAPRQIRDTSYIARVAMEYLRHACSEVVATRGSYTAYLRTAWGLPKDRHDERRHFVDAAVINATDRRVIQWLNTLSARGALPKASQSGIEPPWPDFAADVMTHYGRIWPSLRPDRSVPSNRYPHTKSVRRSGELHNALPLGTTDGEGDDTVRLTRRRSPEELFKKLGKLVSDEKAEEAMVSFVSPRFAERFRDRIERRRAASPAGTPLAQLGLDAAADSHWGPRGIGEIRCFEDEIQRKRAELDMVPRGNHRAVVDAQANAWMEIRRGDKGRWKGSVVTVLEAARRGPPPTPASPGNENLVVVLQRNDLVAWTLAGGKREIGWVKKMRKDSNTFFIWPVRLSVTKDAATTRNDLSLGGDEGVRFSAKKFQQADGRPVTVSILGRVRNPGLPGD